MGTPGTRAVLEGLEAFVHAVDSRKIIALLREAEGLLRAGAAQAKPASHALQAARHAIEAAADARLTLNPDAALSFDVAADDLLGVSASRELLHDVALQAGHHVKAADAVRLHAQRLEQARTRAGHGAFLLSAVTPSETPRPDGHDLVTIKFTGKASLDSLGAMAQYGDEFAQFFALMGRISGEGPANPTITSVEEGCLEVTVASSVATIASTIAIYKLVIDIRVAHLSETLAYAKLAESSALDEDTREKLRASVQHDVQKRLDDLPKRIVQVELLSPSENRGEIENLLSKQVQFLNRFIENGGSLIRGVLSSPSTKRLMEEANAMLPAARDAKVAGLLKAPSEDEPKQ